MWAALGMGERQLSEAETTPEADNQYAEEQVLCQRLVCGISYLRKNNASLPRSLFMKQTHRAILSDCPQESLCPTGTGARSPSNVPGVSTASS